MNRFLQQLLLPAAVLLLSAQLHAQLRFGTQRDTVFYLPVKSGNLWGYADSTGRVRIPPAYDAAGYFTNNIAIVQQHGKAFAIDGKGRVITPEGFGLLRVISDSILAFYSDTPDSNYTGGWGAVTISGKQLLGPAYDEVIQEDYRVIGFRKDTLWGYMHRKGNLIVPAEYDTAVVTHLKYLQLSKNGKRGLISIYGQWILPADCSYQEWMNDSTLLAKRDSGWGIVSIEGKTRVPFEWDSLRYFSDAFIEVREGDSAALYSATKQKRITGFDYTRFLPLDRYWVKGYTKTKRCALLDTAGKVIIPAEFSDIFPTGTGAWFVVKDRKWGMYSSSGTVLLLPSFSSIQPFRGGVTVFYAPEGQGLMNSAGTILVPAGNYSISIRRNIVKLSKPDGSAEFITVNENGDIVSRDSYEQVRTLSLSGSSNNKTAAVRKGYIAKADSLQWFSLPDRELYGLRNAYTGDTLIRPVFNHIQRTFAGYTLVFIDDTIHGPVVNGEQGISSRRCGIVIDSTGTYLFRPNYLSLQVYDLFWNGFNGYIRGCRTDGVSGLFATDGSERKLAFTWVGPFSDGKAVAVVGGQWVDANATDPEVMGWKEFCTAFSLIPESISGHRGEYSMVSIHGGKWGYIDRNGRFVIPAVYEQARQSYRNTCMVSDTKGWGMLDSTGKVLIPLKYYNLGYVYFSNPLLVTTTVRDPHYGFIDHSGNILIDAKLTQARPVGGGFVGGYSGTGWNVFNSRGMQITTENFTELGVFSEGILPVRKGNRWGFIDTTGAWIINPIYEKTRSFSNGKCAVRLRAKWGFADTTGRLVIDAAYADVTDFLSQSAGVKTQSGWKLIDAQGNFIGKSSFTALRIVPGTNLYCGKRSQKLGLFSGSGIPLTAESYDDFGEYSCGRILLRKEGKYGFCDTSGKIIVSPSYDRALPFSENFAAVRTGNRWGFIALNGKLVIAATYKTAGSFSCARAGIVNDKNKFGYIDTTGKIIFMLPKGCAGSSFAENRALINAGRRGCYYVNRSGQQINRERYSSGQSFNGGVAVVQLCDYYGLISFTGEYIVSPRYNRIEKFNGPLARYQQEFKTGLYTATGKELVPAEYDRITPVFPGIFSLVKGNQLGYLQSNGSWVWKMQE